MLILNPVHFLCLVVCHACQKHAPSVLEIWLSVDLRGCTLLRVSPPGTLDTQVDDACLPVSSFRPG
jgi:hypothetical protein